jgi:hypothetical protein
MGKGRRGDRSTTELPGHMEPRIGVEPMTDNPMSSAHQLSAGKRSTVELPSVLLLHYRRSIRWRELVTAAGETTERS